LFALFSSLLSFCPKFVFGFEKKKNNSGNRIYEADKYAQIDEPLDNRTQKALIHTPENRIQKSTIHIQGGGTWIGVKANPSPCAALFVLRAWRGGGRKQVFIPRVHRLLLCVRSPVCDLGFFFPFVLVSLRSFLFLLLFSWRCFQFPVPHNVADTW
jgi:hypothetical protein